MTTNSNKPHSREVDTSARSTFVSQCAARICLLAVAVCFCGFGGLVSASAATAEAPAASTAAATNSPVEREFMVLEKKVLAKIQQGARTEQELAPEIKEFNALLDRYKADKTEEMANILLMKAKLYLEVFDDTSKGAEIIQQLQREYPETNPGRAAFMMLEAINQQENAKRLEGALIVGTAFPGFDEKDTADKPLSLAAYKGKVVLVDFWATWSDGWQKTLPTMLAVYEKHHAKGFEILGVGLDEDKKQAADFVKEQKMNWRHYVDGQGWKNKLAAKCGVHRLPCNYLLNGEGRIVGRNLTGTNLVSAVAKAISENQSKANGK